MNELRIKLKHGDFEIELEGDKETVQKEFASLRENELGKLFNSPPASTKSGTKETNQKTESRKRGVKKENTNSASTKESRYSAPRKKPISNHSYHMLPDLNLRPKGKQTFEDFYNSFSIKSNLERNISILYYLKMIVEVESVNIDHIYTCYKKVGVKVPNLYQSLVDTKNRKGWIETNNMDDLKVTISGENYIEHEAPKKENE